jgi:hypothetical protein
VAILTFRPRSAIKVLVPVCLAALVVGAVSGARGAASAVVEPGGTGWDAVASALGGFSGERFSFTCPSYGGAQTVWGTDVYTLDSSVCTAAVLEGRLTLAGGGSVTVQIGPTRSSFTGSTRNGIASSSFGSDDGSYVLVDAKANPTGVADGGTGWSTDSAAYASFLGARFVFDCPASGTLGSVWGTGVYTDDSSICTAAVLERRITPLGGGSVTIEIRPGQSSYKGSTSNGVTSNNYGVWNASYVIVGATRAVPVPGSGGTGWDANATALRGLTGQRFVFTCPSYGSAQAVWGTDVYTDDSSVCTAAVLQGRITLAGGGAVTVEIRPGQSSYPGSSGNGITSNSYSSWGGSYTLVAASPMTAGVANGGTGWNASAQAYAGFLGASFVFACPAAGAPGAVWGTAVYTGDSSVCTAAVLAGLITVALGGTVTAEMRPGQHSYTGSTRNGVTSESYASFNASYVLPAGGATTGAPAAPGGGSSPSVASPPPAPTGPLSPPLPPPVGGLSVDVKTLQGTVLVNGRPLKAGQRIRVGAIVNATKGTITMTSASPTGTLQTANFASGTYKVLQKGRKGPTELALSGGSFALCKRTTASAAPAKPRIVRALWGNGKGQFRTNGRYAAATVRGTIWLTEDRCDGTLIVVKRGTVTVLDLVRHVTVTVKAGHSYLARA